MYTMNNTGKCITYRHTLVSGRVVGMGRPSALNVSFSSSVKLTCWLRIKCWRTEVYVCSHWTYTHLHPCTSKMYSLTYTCTTARKYLHNEFEVCVCVCVCHPTADLDPGVNECHRVHLRCSEGREGRWWQ